MKAKNDEALASRKRRDDGDENDKEYRNKAAEDAYKSWLTDKAKQKKHEKTLERFKQEEEASSYVIRQRQACEEAFNR